MSSLIIAVIIVVVLKLLFSGSNDEISIDENKEFEWWLEDGK